MGNVCSEGHSRINFSLLTYREIILFLHFSGKTFAICLQEKKKVTTFAPALKEYTSGVFIEAGVNRTNFFAFKFG
jgi:hypothetical protein